MVTINEGARLQDVVDWMVHHGYCVESYKVDLGDVAKSKGDKLVGEILIFGVNSNPKLVDTTGDSLGATSDLGILLEPSGLTADKAADATDVYGREVPVLVRGPARIHNQGLKLDTTTATLADAKAALDAVGVQFVDETGLEYTSDP